MLDMRVVRFTEEKVIVSDRIECLIVQDRGRAILCVLNARPIDHRRGSCFTYKESPRRRKLHQRMMKTWSFRDWTTNTMG